MSDPEVFLRVDKEPPTLEEAQELVGGMVELVMLSDGDQMLVNEEGLLYGLPYNQMASEVANRHIVGNALILRGKSKWT